MINVPKCIKKLLEVTKRKKAMKRADIIISMIGIIESGEWEFIIDAEKIIIM